MSKVFKVPIDEINDSISSDTIKEWDSMTHMNFITALEEEFEVRFSDQEIGEMLNYKLIHVILQRHGVK